MAPNVPRSGWFGQAWQLRALFLGEKIGTPFVGPGAEQVVLHPLWIPLSVDVPGRIFQDLCPRHPREHGHESVVAIACAVLLKLWKPNEYALWEIVRNCFDQVNSTYLIQMARVISRLPMVAVIVPRAQSKVLKRQFIEREKPGFNNFNRVGPAPMQRQIPFHGQEIAKIFRNKLFRSDHDRPQTSCNDRPNG